MAAESEKGNCTNALRICAATASGSRSTRKYANFSTRSLMNGWIPGPSVDFFNPMNNGETIQAASPPAPERVKMARARAIVGLDERVMQLMAEAGEIPGAIKIRGVWTFDETRLRNW